MMEVGPSPSGHDGNSGEVIQNLKEAIHETRYVYGAALELAYNLRLSPRIGIWWKTRDDYCH